uniref:Uncharacterized protein n=1 Tax=Opuntia streptacantha TaxID=393608 RepID=A0A7C9EM19_OPUST
MSRYSVDYASIILNHMYRIANLSLPYGNLLTRIFTHFRVPLENEECHTQPIPTISAHALKTLKFYKTNSRGWQHLSNLTLAEASSLKVTLPDQPSTNIAQTLVDVQSEHAELRDQIENVELEIGLIHRKLDELIRMTSLIHRGVKLVMPL